MKAAKARRPAPTGSHTVRAADCPARNVRTNADPFEHAARRAVLERHVLGAERIDRRRNDFDALDRELRQVSRFDPWKDPEGVIAAYRLAREEVPDLELALVGSMALDDPQGWDIYAKIKAEVDADPRIHLFTNLTGVSNVEVNAFQRLSRVIIQKSVREGFGLVVSEAMWKGTPVVAGRAGGIPLQMADGVGGVLVDGIESCARGLVTLLGDRDRAGELGRLGRERVRQRFLTPRLVADELELLATLASEESPSFPDTAAAAAG
jgi:trehalose synthase